MRRSARLLVASLAALAGLSASPAAIAQETEQNAEVRNIPPAGDVKVAAEADFFFLNLEYFAPYAEGYTLVGYKLRPTLTWTPAAPFSLIGGLQALAYGGLEKMHYVRPYFAAQVRHSDWLTLQMGCLPGPQSHPLHEAVLENEDEYTEVPELGAQVWLTRPKLDAQVWLNWRQFIFQGDTIPEMFTAGMIFDIRPGRSRAEDGSWAYDGKTRFNIPLALVFEHVGGQISNYSQPMQSLANLSAEPTLTIETEGRPFLKQAQFKLSALLFHTMAGSSVRPMADGWALSPQVSVVAKRFDASVGWFHASNFFAMRGNPLFMSISNYDPEVYDRQRDIVTLSAAFETDIAKVAQFRLEFKGYNDVRAGRFDYSYGMTLNANPIVWERRSVRSHAKAE